MATLAPDQPRLSWKDIDPLPLVGTSQMAVNAASGSVWSNSRARSRRAAGDPGWHLGRQLRASGPPQLDDPPGVCPSRFAMSRPGGPSGCGAFPAHWSAGRLVRSCRLRRALGRVRRPRGVSFPAQSRKALRKPCTVTSTPMRSKTFSIAEAESGSWRWRPGNTKSETRISSSLSRISTARSLSGTRCSRPAFIRRAGMVQTRASRSISLQRAPRTSPERVAVRMANSSARAATTSLSRSLAMKAGTSA